MSMLERESDSADVCGYVKVQMTFFFGDVKLISVPTGVAPVA